jgi:hypothetical protein
MTLLNSKLTQRLHEIPEIHTGWATFSAYLTGKTIPDRIPGNQVGIKKRFLDDPPGRLPELDTTEKLGHGTTRRTLAALETAGKLILLD